MKATVANIIFITLFTVSMVGCCMIEEEEEATDQSQDVQSQQTIQKVKITNPNVKRN